MIYSLLIATPDSSKEGYFHDLFKIEPQDKFNLVFAENESDCILLAKKNTIDLLILDATFSKNIVDFIQNYKKTKVDIAIPIIVIAENPTLNQIKEWFAIGIVDLIRKPLESIEFVLNRLFAHTTFKLS